MFGVENFQSTIQPKSFQFFDFSTACYEHQVFMALIDLAELKKYKVLFQIEVRRKHSIAVIGRKYSKIIGPKFVG